MSGPSAADLISALRARGISVRDLARECDRDTSLIYQVAAGKRQGANLLPTLTDIARTGFALHRPERRVDKAGRQVNVRAARGGDPKPPPPATPTALRPGQFGVTQAFLGGGGKTLRITAPKVSKVGRARAQDAAMDALRTAAAEQRRVAFTVHFGDGSTRSLGSKGGYRGNVAYDRAMGEWENAFEWLTQEVNAVVGRIGSPEISAPIIGLDVTIFGQPDPSQPVPASARSRPSAPAKKAPAKKAPAKKAPAKKTPAKKARRDRSCNPPLSLHTTNTTLQQS
jgi:hypothetical protein